MALLGFQVNKTPASNNFFKEFFLKSKNESLLKNPFTIKAKLISEKEKLLFICDIVPVYPTIHYWGWLGVVIIFLFKGFSWLMLIPAPLVLIGVVWSKPFYMLMLWLGLRKNGYKGKIKILSNKTIILRLAGWLK